MKRMLCIVLVLCVAGLIQTALAEPEILVPEEYTKNGTLPVYKATERDFGANLQPELFNTSGIAKKEAYCITFNDGAQLSWSPETLFYITYQGTYNANYKRPECAPDIVPLQSLSSAASEFAGNIYSNGPEDPCTEGITLENNVLSRITLDEAKAQVEALLAALCVKGYTCDWALDMDVERIQQLGAQHNQAIQNHDWSNSPIRDYSLATTKDEGFYLHCQNGVKTGDGRFDLHAYVTGDGIANFMLRDQYIRGDVCYTPEALLSPEAAMERLPAEMANSKFAGMKLHSIQSISLVYTPTRAENKADGMVFTPAWYILYQDTEAAGQNYDCYAIFNAVDGRLISAIFQ